MADALSTILARRDWDEPPEARIIRDYVERFFKVTPKVTVQANQIIIGVQSAALAGALRTHLYRLAQECGGTKKRLVIRIGGWFYG